MLTPRQTNREELLDLHHGSLSQVRQSLHDIRRINTYLGGRAFITSDVLNLLQKHGLRRATVLDIGTGAADIPVWLIRQAQKRGIELEIIALDVNARHLQIAREEVGGNAQIHLLQADAFALPLRDKSVDIAMTSLFLHHFRAPQITQLLTEFNRVSRVGWVAGDLVRDFVPLAFFRLTRPIFARSYITRHDGEASIRRGYTLSEMQRIVNESSLPDILLEERFPYRMSLVCDKSERDDS